jgi:DNA-binding NarL/FixJ family response regulator
MNPPAPFPLYKHRMTKRQREVLTLVANGYDNDEIAKELYVSVNTIEKILIRAYTNLGIRRNRRTNAVAVALALGEIRTDAIQLPQGLKSTAEARPTCPASPPEETP